MLKSGKFQICTLSFVTLTIAVKGQMDSHYLRHQNQLNPDITYGLTDNDLKLALNDLSLNDLKSLQQLIDYADYNYLDYQENSGKLNSIQTKDFNNREFNNVMDYPDQDDYSFGSQNNEKDLIYGHKPHMQFLQESQRTKRADQKSDINDEYIKQLDYSFSQNKQRNNDIELKKSHIRVKRN